MVLPASAEVIDLSLDTPAKEPNRVQARTSQSFQDFVVLSDDSDSVVVESQEWEERPAKRRRRSASLQSEKLIKAREEEERTPRWRGESASVEDGTLIGLHGWESQTPRRRRKSASPESDTLVDLKDYTRRSTDRGLNVGNGSRRVGGLKRTVTLSLDGSDPVLYPSPPQPASRIGFEERQEWFTLEEDDSDSLDYKSAKAFAGLTKSEARAASDLSNRTLALLANLSSDRNPRSNNAIKAKSTSETRLRMDTNSGHRSESLPDPMESENGDNASQHDSHPTRARKRAKLTDAEKMEKANSKAKRQQDKQKRLAEKEAEKERKQKAKEEKAREKEAAAELAQANRSKTNKNLSTPEMIVDLPDSLEGTPVGEQVKSLLENIGVELSSYSPLVQNVIKWRRKVTAVYNEELGYWEPVSEHITDEKLVMCVMGAQELVDLICAGSTQADDEDLDAFVLRLKSTFEGRRVMFLIEGLANWMRKNKNVRNRAYRAAVMEGAADEAATGGGDPTGAQRQGRRQRRKPQPEYIDEDMIEDGFLRLQVMHTCLIHHTSSVVETAEWIAIFTQHISTIPYKTERMNLPTSFCMDVGQVKCGVDPRDTYLKMLQQIVRVTPPVAHGIVAEYPTVQSLVKALEEGGPTALQFIRKTANANGAFTNANLGPAISRRIHKIFTGRDPGSYDV